MKNNIDEVLKSQEIFFNNGNTLKIEDRIKKLQLLAKEIESAEDQICAALYSDFKKPVFESVLSETAFILSELQYIVKKLKKWARPKKVSSSLINFPSSDYIYSEPYGKCLIIAPWNYPFQLAISPIMGAIAAGNTVVLKPSELTPNTSKILEELLQKVFPADWVSVIQGGVEVSQELLTKKWDYVFFTGSVSVGKIVAQAIAPHLTPSTLELGGKSPCIIHKSAKVQLAAKRIVWGKFLNAGQTCIAPDYILIDSSIKKEFIDAVQKEVKSAYGTNPKDSPDFARIINEKNFDRLSKMLIAEMCPIGGHLDKEQLYMAPTLIEEPALTSKVMEDEIFGPILPVLSFYSEEQMAGIMANYSKPLALYVFSEDRKYSEEILGKYSFGGGAINDVVIQIANKKMPFGGVGSSGSGAYHGKHSFDTFSHKKSITKRGTWLDVPLRYAPYGNKVGLISKIMKKL
ncbi:aldehyde dehydrogenase (NAD+) [Gillisia sp. Hel_I_86]|uniref:aldehyde dehydrogenase n=1 Tax=Gillisia sp. Hel_I_86 TaxID=1249981 RepID=UPI00119ABED0|nr:aldehyde dehydrogenase [Gillisia sp. Hel_I_86]TVZ25290.1 aldehyde dehydrogenase (NAD+) [Gillisia sp. Hel_I_86]